MKKTAICIVVIFVSFNIGVFCGCEKQVEPTEKKSVQRVYVEKNADIINSMIKHIGLAEETLEAFGFSDSEEALKFWAQGIIKRNGVMQYTVMDSTLKNEFKEHLALQNNTSWITGEDDIQIIAYEIINCNVISDKMKIYKVKFQLGLKDHEEEKEVNVTLTEKEENWVIESILM